MQGKVRARLLPRGQGESTYLPFSVEDRAAAGVLQSARGQRLRAILSLICGEVAKQPSRGGGGRDHLLDPASGMMLQVGAGESRDRHLPVLLVEAM